MEFKAEFHSKVNEKDDILIIAKSATVNKWKTCLQWSHDKDNEDQQNCNNIVGAFTV